MDVPCFFSKRRTEQENEERSKIDVRPGWLSNFRLLYSRLYDQSRDAFKQTQPSKSPPPQPTSVSPPSPPNSPMYAIAAAVQQHSFVVSFARETHRTMPDLHEHRRRNSSTKICYPTILLQQVRDPGEAPPHPARPSSFS